jgi:chemosensory pili system protein ChpA (sensor histidine kinase/response regulator)
MVDQHPHNDLETETQDLGPLAWVLDETRKSIAAATQAFKRYAHEAQAARGIALESVDASPLRMACQQLHQVEGALEMVGQTIAAHLVNGMESVMRRFAAKPQEIDQKCVAVQETAGFALIEYLESQLSSQPRPALGLFAQYRQIQELAGADRIHPADLWDWPWQWAVPQLPQTAQRPGYSTEARQSLDRGILRVMRHDDTRAAAELSAVSLGLAAGEKHNRRSRHPMAFWVLAAGFFEALGNQLIPFDFHTKRAISRVLLQYVTLASGDDMVAERLAHDLLFFCAQARPSGTAAATRPALAAVRAAWELDRHAPVDYTQPIFGLYDPAVLTQARQRVDAIKENWSALAGGDMTRLKGCTDQLGLLTQSLARLLPKAQPLADELNAVMAQINRTNHPPSPELAMETATAVLFLEASFADFHPADTLMDTRMQQLAQRLKVVREGTAIPALEPWMEALYRQVSNRQAMGTVVDELRVTMGEVETCLDQFFRQPADQARLAPVPDLMNQMRGVLSVLGLDQAVQAVAHMGEQVEGLIASGSEQAGPASGVFEQLGNSLGALGFMVDMLDYQPALARKLFVYDAESGQLKTPLGHVRAQDTALTAKAAASAEVPDAAETGQIKPGVDLSEPDDFPQTALAPAADPAPGPARQGIDADLLDIFLDEAREVIALGHSAIEALAAAPGDAEQKTILRRAFHTLKGSARMVGLPQFGEAAWALEQVLNLSLAEQKPADTHLRSLSAQALSGLGRWADDIAAKRAEHWSAAPFQQAADALRLRGQYIPLDWDSVAAAGGADLAETGQPEAPAPAFTPTLNVDFLPDLNLKPTVPSPFLEPTVPLPFLEPTVPLPFLEPTVPLPLEFAASTPGTKEPALQDPTQLFDFDWGTRQDKADAAAGAEAGAGSAQADSASIPLLPVGEAQELDFAAFDQALQSIGAASGTTPQALEPACAGQEPASVPTDGQPQPATSKTVEQSAPYKPYRQIGDLRISAELYDVYLEEAQGWSRELGNELTLWEQALDRPVPEHAIARAHALAGSSATAGLAALSGLARALEHALIRLRAQDGGRPAQLRALGDAAAEIRRALHQFTAGSLHQPSQAALDAVNAVDVINAPAQAPEPAPVTLKNTPQHAKAGSIGIADAIDPELFPLFEEETGDLLPQLQGSLREWMAAPGNNEARQQVQRFLHTLKGSARLAGALRLGEMVHRAESAIEAVGTAPLAPADLEPVLNHVDEIAAAFTRLRASQQPESEADGTAPVAAAAGPSITASAAAWAEQAAGQPLPAQSGEIAPPAPLSLRRPYSAVSQVVRVKTQLLDHLVNQAGEVMTLRSRLETEFGQLRLALTDLSGNLGRLRAQLRDVELQAEVQMQSRMAQAKEGPQNFDPLEFDRFTRMQELTRMMAESVNDVATVQDVLRHAVESGEDDLAAQARQARELQHGLLRTRMVEFESISERLHRVVRQVAREQDKQVRLDIIGGAIEVDRGILERMAAPFEHLLRNSVVHGIEAAPLRAKRHKDATGVIIIEVRQTGNDVSIEFRDDGNGLNLPHIRRQAEHKGLIEPGQPLPDNEIANLIFASGLSTASQVSGLAGRGVGLDVVRAEVRALGGRIETHSQAERETAFKLVLPLTTAVTQVLMLRIGDVTIGVPTNLVETVLRVSNADLQKAYDSGLFSHDQNALPLFWGGALLQTSPRSQESTPRSAPVIVFHSAAQRLAVHVDEVLGNQEVVVKTLGTQLSRLPGLAAISTLAAGEVLLIYNPVALVNVYGDRAKALTGAKQTAPSDAALPPEAPLVLVVDDSITVRRINQRLLQREGYRVALAADGLQGLEQLRKERPAVVLSDIEMPRMDGFDFVRNIRADPQWRDLPVIMITSRIAEKHREHARQLGVSHYLGKPYSEEELLALIRDHVRTAAQARA